MYGELTCKELVELLTDYLEGQLDRAHHEEVEVHLLNCPGCQIYLDQFRETIAMSGALREDDVPEPVLDELLEAFRSLKRR